MTLLTAGMLDKITFQHPFWPKLFYDDPAAPERQRHIGRGEVAGYLNLLQQETLCPAIVVEHPEMKYWLIQQPNIHSASCSLSSPVGLGENRDKARRQVDWDNDSSWLFGKTNATNPNVSSFSFFPWAFSAFLTSYGMEHPLQQLGTAVLAISPPSLLLTSSLPVGDEDRRESHDTLQTLSNNSLDMHVLMWWFVFDVMLTGRFSLWTHRIFRKVRRTTVDSLYAIKLRSSY